MQPLPSEREKSERRLRRAVILAVAALIVLASVGSCSRIAADYMWHVYDSGAVIVFSTSLKTRLLVFVIAFLAAFSAIFFTGRFAMNTLIIFGRTPATIVDALLTGVIRFLQTHGPALNKLVATVFGLILASWMTSNWELFLRFTHAVPFEKSDPLLNIDYGFYVFKFELYQLIVGWLLALWFVCAIIAAATYAAVRGTASLARMPLTTPSTRMHLTLLAAAGLVLFGCIAYLKRYSLLTSSAGGFAGPGYSAVKQMTAYEILAYLLWIGALLAAFNAKFGRPYRALTFTIASALLVLIVGVGLYPSIVQSYEVKPNELLMQRPYILHSINATRWAYRLDAIEEHPVTMQDRPTDQELKDASDTLENIRLWDPEILRGNTQVQQSLRNYYVFQDMDVDRYLIDGKQRLIMLGARDLLTSGLPERTSTWQNERMQYTHGNGIVAARVNAVTPQGNPDFLMRDVPPTGVPELSVDEPRIYFSDMVDSAGNPDDHYVIVRSKLPEFDFTSSKQEIEHRWNGSRGIPIDSFFTRLLFSFFLSDQNIFLNQSLTPESRLLWRRSVRVRAKAIFPWVVWDPDPYIAVIDRHAVWILDGYTLTDQIPYSAMETMQGVEFNYIRNSIKMTIDAYTGEWKAYIMEPNDPIVRCYDSIYPGLLTPESKMPDSLRRHLRYAEQMFLAQSLQLGRYHLTDPTRFYRADDVWAIAQQTTAEGAASQMSPYYVQMRLPDEKRSAFLLILPFTPADRPNMIGWLAAHSDPGEYGRLTLYKFQTDKNVNGPAQQEAKFDNDVELSKILTLLNQRGSRIRHGNLLVMPIGKSVLYLKTLFLEADRPGIPEIPELKLVVLAFGDQIAFAPTFDGALAKLTGAEQPAAAQTPPPSPQPEPNQGIQKALEILNRSEAAMKAGDWAEYGKAQAELKALLIELAKGSTKR